MLSEEHIFASMWFSRVSLATLITSFCLEEAQRDLPAARFAACADGGAVVVDGPVSKPSRETQSKAQSICRILG